MFLMLRDSADGVTCIARAADGKCSVSATVRNAGNQLHRSARRYFRSTLLRYDVSSRQVTFVSLFATRRCGTSNVIDGDERNGRAEIGVRLPALTRRDELAGTSILTGSRR